jgi:hypothetical protein
MMNILDIVKNTPNEFGTNPKCPHCDSENLHQGDRISTLVGSLGDGPDPNHHWISASCRDCKAQFTIEQKYDNWWITKDSKVLSGMPCCFETYIYECSKCGGPVKRKYTNLDGKSTAEIEILCTSKDDNGNWVRKYRIFYRCEDCDYGGEVESDYWLYPKES